MHKFINALLLIVIGSFIISCTTSTRFRGDVYNPATQQVEHYSYQSYFQLKTDIIPEKLKFTLVTHLNKETIPGAYSVKKFTRRLLPNDYMVSSDVMLYLENLSHDPISLELISISVDQKHLPYSARNISLAANESMSLSLGQILVDLRLTSLNTRVEYRAGGHQEKEYDMRRISRNEDLHEEIKTNNTEQTQQKAELKENDPLEKHMRGTYAPLNK